MPIDRGFFIEDTKARRIGPESFKQSHSIGGLPDIGNPRLPWASLAFLAVLFRNPGSSLSLDRERGRVRVKWQAGRRTGTEAASLKPQASSRFSSRLLRRRTPRNDRSVEASLHRSVAMVWLVCGICDICGQEKNPDRVCRVLSVSDNNRGFVTGP